MGRPKLCGECGVPLRVSKEVVWHDNGVITQARDENHRMLFYESDNLDRLFRGIEEMIGLPIEHIIIESKRRVTKEYVERLIPAPVRKLLYVFRPSLIINMVSATGRSYGYGDIKLEEMRKRRDEGDYTKMLIRDPYSILFFTGDLVGAFEAVDGREFQASYRKVGEGEAYEVVGKVGKHPIELQERLKPREYPRKPGDVRFERCGRCGLPREVGKFRWDLERGLIINPETGRRMAIFGPAGFEAIMDDLEAELGETIPEVIVEAQRRFVKDRLREEDWRRSPGHFKRMMALRGLGNITELQISGERLHVVIENPCLTLLAVGMVKGLYELAMGLERTEHSWERTAEGDLEITIKAT